MYIPWKQHLRVSKNKMTKTGNKQKISITLDEETLKLIENALQGREFRNRSHAIELSINKMLNGKGEK